VLVLLVLMLVLMMSPLREHGGQRR